MKRILLSAAVLCAACAFGMSDTLASALRDERLYYAIRMAESDDGLTSDNVYQLTYRHYRDVLRITGGVVPTRSGYRDVSRDADKSTRAVAAYWAYYGQVYEREYGKAATPEVLAKIHRVGYAGLRTRRFIADAYWKRVSKYYNREKAK